MFRSALTFCLAAVIAPGLMADEPPPVVAAAGEPTTYPELWINGLPTGEFVRLESRSSADARPLLLLDALELRARGIVLADPEVDADGRVVLGQLQDVRWQNDEAAQRLLLELPVSRLRLNRFRAGGSYEAPQAGGQGILVNYELLAQTTRPDAGARQDNMGGYAEARWFGPLGYLQQTGVVRQSDGVSSRVRLDTAFRHSSPDGLWTLQAGDSISYGVATQSAYRFGGVQWRRNFTLRPDLITFPVPDIKGGSAVPATVDVYLNNIRQLSQAVPSGPFEISNVPVTTGAGDLRVVVRDVLGREQITTIPLYSVASLLRPGLSDFAVQTGFLRRNYGTLSNDYATAPVASAAYRRGITTRLTGESHAELTEGLGVAGLGGTYALSRWSTVSLAAAASKRSRPVEGSSQRGSLSYQFQSATGWSFFLASQRTGNGFRDLASQDNSVITRATDQAGLGASLGRFGNLGVSYVSQETSGGIRDQLVNASWSRSLSSQFYVYVSLLQGLGASDQQGVYGGISWYPAERSSISSSVTTNRGQRSEYSIGAQQTAAGDIGLDWRVQARMGNTDTQQAEVRYRSGWGETGVAVEHAAVADSVRLQQSGALVFMGGGVHAGRRINQSFAVVDTGLAGVPVRSQNRLMGVTDRNGQILVTDLRSYQRNKISIDALNVPAGVVVRNTEIDAVPPEQSGVRVQLSLREPQAALLQFVDEQGQPLPVGAQGSIAGSPLRFVVGYDGEVYLEDVLGEVTVTVIHGQTRCIAHPNITSGSLARSEALPPVVCKVWSAASRPVMVPATQEKPR